MERKKNYVLALMGSVLALSCVTAGFGTASAADEDPWPVTLRNDMRRLTDVSYRIAETSAPMCPARKMGTGIALDFIQAYEEPQQAAIAAMLHLSHVPQVAAVAAGSPAERAGVKTGDDLVEIDGVPVETLLARSSDPSLFSEEMEQRIADSPAGRPVVLGLKREGHTVRVSIDPEPICASKIVIKTGLGIDAFSDGDNVAISTKLIEFARNDDELALIVAHEVGHVINRDDKAPSLRARRNMEDAADRVGIRLVKCARYDPERAVQFWIHRDATDWLRLLRAPTHRAGKARVALMRQEAATASCPPVADPVTKQAE